MSCHALPFHRGSRKNRKTLTSALSTSHACTTAVEMKKQDIFFSLSCAVCGTYVERRAGDLSAREVSVSRSLFLDVPPIAGYWCHVDIPTEHVVTSAHLTLGCQLPCPCRAAFGTRGRVVFQPGSLPYPTLIILLRTFFREEGSSSSRVLSSLLFATSRFPLRSLLEVTTLDSSCPVLLPLQPPLDSRRRLLPHCSPAAVVCYLGGR